MWTSSLRRYQDLDWLERISLIPMSYSRLNTYHDLCPLRYYYTYIVEEPRQFGAPAALGSILHEVLERADHPLSWEQMTELFQDAKLIHDPDSLVDDGLLSLGTKMLEEHLSRHEGEIPDVIGRELEFKVVLGRGYFTGYIDLVSRGPQGIEVTDYKSGKWQIRHPPGDDLQLGLYALVAKDLFPAEEIYAQLYYLRAGKVKAHHFTEDDLHQVEQRLLEYINTIIDDTEFQPTKDRGPCYWCDHQKSGACSIGVKRTKK